MKRPPAERIDPGGSARRRLGTTGDDVLRLTVNRASGDCIQIEAQPEWHLQDLQEAVQARCNIPVGEQRLCVGGACLNSSACVGQHLGTILGETRQLTLARIDRSLALAVAVFGEYSGDPKIAIDGEELVLRWLDGHDCYFGDENVRPDGRTLESAIEIELKIPSVELPFKVSVAGEICIEPVFVPLTLPDGEVFSDVRLHIGPWFFPDIISLDKYTQQHPFKREAGAQDDIVYEVRMWCRRWVEELPTESISLQVKTNTSQREFTMRLPGFSPMLVAEMWYNASEAVPLGEMFFFHKGRGNVSATMLASDLQLDDKQPTVDALLYSEHIGPYRSKKPISRNDVQRHLCSQAEVSPPRVRKALEELNAILFAGCSELRKLSGEGISTDLLGQVFSLAQFWCVVKESTGADFNKDFDKVYDRWRNLELAS